MMRVRFHTVPRSANGVLAHLFKIQMDHRALLRHLSHELHVWIFLHAFSVKVQSRLFIEKPMRAGCIA
jgi:hypothetical protein